MQDLSRCGKFSFPFISFLFLGVVHTKKKKSMERTTIIIIVLVGLLVPTFILMDARGQSSLMTVLEKISTQVLNFTLQPPTVVVVHFNHTVPVAIPGPIETGYPMLALRPSINNKMKVIHEMLAKHQTPSGEFDRSNMIFSMYEATHECLLGEDRIGYLGEGGKWVCGMKMLSKIPHCVAYSMGSNGQLDFEKDLLAVTNKNCEVHSFDFGDFSKSFVGTGIQFHKVFISGKDDPGQNRKTFQTIMKELNHTHIDLLKMDIEWSEYDVLSTLAESSPLPWIGQLQVEIHLRSGDFGANKWHWIDKIEKIIRDINKLGLYQFHREVNPGDANCHEFAFGSITPRPN